MKDKVRHQEIESLQDIINILDSVRLNERIRIIEFIQSKYCSQELLTQEAQ